PSYRQRRSTEARPCAAGKDWPGEPAAEFGLRRGAEDSRCRRRHQEFRAWHVSNRALRQQWFVKLKSRAERDYNAQQRLGRQVDFSLVSCPLETDDIPCRARRCCAMISPELLEILRCPLDPSHTRLTLQESEFLCERCRVRFPIKDGF